MAPVDITVVSRNVYIGADVDAVIRALFSEDPGDDLPALFTAIETLEKTSFGVRARALAAELARTRPHFVGLQEISNVDIEIPLLGVSMSLDFLAILQEELAQRGLNYVVAAQVENSNVLLTPIPGSTIQVVDFDVIMVDAERVSFDAASVVAQNFSNNIGELAPGVNVVRGWVAITAEVRGILFRVVNTHLESGNDNPALPQLRAAQAIELVTLLGDANPAIFMGDMNDVEGSLMYQVVTGAGFRDVWEEVNGHRDGYTCCHEPDLSNMSGRGVLNQRIDYVFVRGAAEHGGRLSGRARLLGDDVGERVAGPEYRIWPSDHAGVVATVRFGPVE
jgi:endonuclease/exonuclease/phosphatase family metal-dependent hydrolase